MAVILVGTLTTKPLIFLEVRAGGHEQGWVVCYNRGFFSYQTRRQEYVLQPPGCGPLFDRAAWWS